MEKSESEDAPEPKKKAMSRYESQKRRDWATFTRYLAAHRPPLELRRCSGAHVLEFLRHLDRFGKTRVHIPHCPSYGGTALSSSTANTHFHPCQCPLQQAWGSLDALVGRLRAAFADNDNDNDNDNNKASINPFAARAVRLYLRDVRDTQSRARGISYAKKKKKKKKVRTNKTKIGRGKLDDDAAGSGKAAVASSSKTSAENPAASCSGRKTTAVQQAAAPALEPLPPCLPGVPIGCYYDVGLGGLGGGLYLPLLFNAFT